MRRSIAALAALGCLLLTAARPAAPAGETLDVPVVLSLSGPGAFIGREEQRALSFVEQTVNATGGIHGRQLRFVVSDDQSSPQVAVQLVNGIVASKAAVMIGPTLAGACFAVAPLVKSGPVNYCLSPSIKPEPNGYVFSASVSTKDLAATMLRYFRMRGWKKLALITSTDASGQDGDSVFASALALPENRDVTLVAHEHFAIGDVSVAAQIARIKAAAPQALLTWTTGTPAGTVLHAIADAGLDIPVELNTGNMVFAQMNQYKDILPRQLYFPGVRVLSHDLLLRGPLRAAQDRYFSAYEKAGTKPDVAPTYAWDPGMIVADALRALPPSAGAAALREYIRNLRGYSGILGVYNFSDGSQRGLTERESVIARWDSTTSTWLPVSQPGGIPLKLAR